MDIVVQVATKLTHKTLQRVDEFAREHGIVHKSSGKVNNAEALRRLIEFALDAQADGDEADDEQTPRQ